MNDRLPPPEKYPKPLTYPELENSYPNHSWVNDSRTGNLMYAESDGVRYENALAQISRRKDGSHDWRLLLRLEGIGTTIQGNMPSAKGAMIAASAALGGNYA